MTNTFKKYKDFSVREKSGSRRIIRVGVLSLSLTDERKVDSEAIKDGLRTKAAMRSCT